MILVVPGPRSFHQGMSFLEHKCLRISLVEISSAIRNCLILLLIIV